MKNIQPVTKERLRRFYANLFAGCTVVYEFRSRAKQIVKKMYPHGIDDKSKSDLIEAIKKYGKYSHIDEDIIIDATSWCIWDIDTIK